MLKEVTSLRCTERTTLCKDVGNTEMHQLGQELVRGILQGSAGDYLTASGTCVHGENQYRVVLSSEAQK